MDTSANPPLSSWNGCLGPSCPDVSCGSNKCKNGGDCKYEVSLVDQNEVVSEDVADATAAVVLSVADTVEAVEDATESVAEQPSRVPVCLCPPAYGGDECSEDGLRPPKNVKPPTSALSWFSRSIAKQEDKTAKLSKSKVEINDLWEEKQEAEKMWIEALEKEEAEQREKRVEYFKLNATLVENQAKQIIKTETLQFFHNVMKFKSERNDGNVNIQSCEQAPDCQQFGWFQHLLPSGHPTPGDMLNKPTSLNIART